MTSEVKNISSKDEKIEVSRDLLETLKKDIEGLKEDKNMLLQIADKKALANFYARHQSRLPKEVKLRTIGGKVILGWRTVRDDDNENSINPRNIINRVQEIELVFEDGSKQKYFYGDYCKKYSTVKARVVSSTTDQNGNIALKVVRLDNGKEYEIDIKYVN